LLWWNLLLNTPAGVSCSAQDTAEWTTNPGSPTFAQPWYQATSLPGAVAIAPLSDCFATKDFWRLQPLGPVGAVQTDTKFPRRRIVVAGTEARDLLVAYIPEDRTVNLATRDLPAPATAAWFNPRTGQTTPARAVGDAATYNFATPAAGDWLLVLHQGK